MYLPGVRKEYFVSLTYYYSILDPDGRNIEAICLKPGFWAEPWGWVGRGGVLLEQ